VGAPSFSYREKQGILRRYGVGERGSGALDLRGGLGTRRLQPRGPRAEWHDLFEPGFEWHTREDLPYAGVRKGYEGTVRLRDEWVEAFDDMHVGVDELIDAENHVVAVTRLCGCMRGTG
jgi:hypothetical protein